MDDMAHVLVVGSGGREHAICLKLAESAKVARISVTPGNAGTASSVKSKNVKLNLDDFNDVANWCKQNGVSLVVVGPEDPLANGIVDVLSKHGVPCFGPDKATALIESSKAFAKTFMDKYAIPTARWKSFTDANAACQHIRSAPYKALVVKASGLAAGKGVVVAQNADEAEQAVRRILESKEFGEAGSTVVVEELLEGHEVSCLAFCDGARTACFPMAQDHKRIGDGDTGPNTGGMGAYAPCPLITAQEALFVEREAIQKAVDGMAAEGTPYRGVLFAGIMLTKSGPRVLEYNCRFGDPETQVILPLLKSDLYETMMHCVRGTMATGGAAPEFERERSVVAVVVASGGYPAAYKKGCVISGLDRLATDDSVSVVHAGTALDQDGRLVTSGGRVLAVVATNARLAAAISAANRAAAQVEFEDSYHRRDIGKRALTRSLNYEEAGVSITAGNDLVERIKPFAKATSRPGCDVDLGMFGGMFDLKAAGYKDPLLVSGTDGVGTKLKIAQLVGNHKTIGQDLVAMCVNDVLAHGAEPLFFLDYFACGRLDVFTAGDVIEGVAAGCKIAGCSLLGGETAEMPGMYAPGEYDLAGFTVGAVERDNCLPKLDTVKAGDVVIGIASSGVHSNGFSLVRKLVETFGYDYSMPCPFDSTRTLGDALLTPTKIYARSCLGALRSGRVKAFAHITGGGLTENIPRVLPRHLAVTIDATSWTIPDVFGWMSAQGNVTEAEMARTFNCGLGAVMITSRDDAAETLSQVTSQGERAWLVGSVNEHTGAEPDHSRVLVRHLQTQLTALGNNFPVRSVDGAGGALRPLQSKAKVGVLISGSGTNLQALIDSTRDPSRNSAADIVLVISNVANVQGLERAQRANIPTMVISHKNFKTRLDFDMEVDRCLREAGVQIVCLAGFMRILTGEFTKAWTGGLLNVHPSLLPSFKGSNAHKLVLEAGVRISGCSVHFVTAEVDAGAILVQRSVPVYPDDTESTLQERIKLLEHEAFPEALELVASGRAKYDAASNKVIWS